MVKRTALKANTRLVKLTELVKTGSVLAFMRYRKVFQFLVVLPFLISSVVLARTPLLSQPLVAEHFRITLFNQSEQTAINQIQAWVLHLEDSRGMIVEDADIRIRGGMPAHNHGMPTAPRVSEYLGNGDYLISGIKFHMAGEWQIEFVINANNQQDLVVFTLQL